MNVSFPAVKNNRISNNTTMGFKAEDDDGIEPQLVGMEKELPLSIEQEIKSGFFELKQKFTEIGPSSIYISHIILH